MLLPLEGMLFFHSFTPLPYPLPLPVLLYFFTFRHLPLPVFVIPLLGYFTMSGHQSMQNMPWLTTISQNTRKWNHNLCGIINPPYSVIEHILWVGILRIAHTFYCSHEAWKIWCNSQNIQCRHIICLTINLGVYSPQRWEVLWK